jgi:small subunit ribosomal protein S4e
MLKYASNGREAKSLIKKGKIIVDGKIRKNERFPIGLMDVLSLPDAKENYRVLPEKNGKLILHPITEEESKYKLERVINKTTVKNGLTQLNLHDGRNILVSDEEGANINVNDVLKVSIPNMESLNKISYSTGNNVLIVGGRRHGERGTLTFLGNEPGKKRTAIIRTPTGENIQTLERYVFSIGADEPEISLPMSNFFDKNEE